MQNKKYNINNLYVASKPSLHPVEGDYYHHIEEPILYIVYAYLHVLLITKGPQTPQNPTMNPDAAKI